MEKESKYLNMNKIISISVWGSDPRYCVGAIKNAEIAKKLMPDWKCRIFVDSTVHVKYVNQLHNMSNVEVAEVDDDGVFGAFWRFYSMFESEDTITISRDSDSRISEREVQAIDEWLTSDKKFSIIRDHERHYDWPILAGMWGMKGLLDENIKNIMLKYSKHHFYTSDQIFLKDIVWQEAENNSMIHGFLEVDWMKQNRDKNHFIGQGYDENDKPLYSGDSSGNRI
jgi:protein O-GlcNAc transferase